MSKKNNTITLVLTKSLSKCSKKHKATVACLGLKRMHQRVERPDNVCVRGMINQVNYLLKVEE